MRQRRRRNIVAVVIGIGLSAALAGCVGAGTQTPVSTRPVRAMTIEPTLFAAGASILSGFEVARDGSAEPQWRAGDRVLLGLLISRPPPKGDLVRYLEIELTGDVGTPPMVALTFRPEDGPPMRFESITLETRIRVYDEAGSLIAQSRGAFPHSLLDLGPYDAASYDLERRAAGWTSVYGHSPRTREEVRRGVMGWMSLIMFSGAMGKNKVFTRLVDEVIERPSLIAMLFSPSIALKDGPEGSSILEGGWTPPGGGTLPACRVPLEVSLADTPVVRTTMIVTPCRAPLGLCGGVVSLDGEKANDPRVKVHLELIASARGRRDAGIRVPDSWARP